MPAGGELVDDAIDDSCGLPGDMNPPISGNSAGNGARYVEHSGTALRADFDD
jgi:hypothetical protein